MPTTQKSKRSTNSRRASSRRNGAEARKPQAERHAERTRKKIDERREQASGLTGWVADRAGEWTLDAQDLRFIGAQKYFWNPLIDPKTSPREGRGPVGTSPRTLNAPSTASAASIIATSISAVMRSAKRVP